MEQSDFFLDIVVPLKIVALYIGIFYVDEGLMKDIYIYEACLMGSHVLAIVLGQCITGPFIHSIMWVHCFAIPSMSIVDHFWIGWRNRLNPMTQFVRPPPGLTLSKHVVFAIGPNVDQKDLSDLLRDIHDYQEMNPPYGPIIYVHLYALFYISTLSYFRFFVNVGYTIFMVLQEEYYRHRERQSLEQ